MLVLKEEVQTEIVVKKSRFIVFAKKIEKLSDVKVLVSEIWKQFPDATHVVHAAVCNGTMFSYSDDREPKNTAGRPALEVLKGSGISNICIIIVRYFGGTLLGTGGLVKAYGDSAKAVLQLAKTEELVKMVPISFSISYDLLDRAKQIFTKVDVSSVSLEYGSEVQVSLSVKEENLNELRDEISELTNGKTLLF